MIKNYIQYRTMESTNDYKIVIFMSLRINNNFRSLSQLKCNEVVINHFGKNNNTMWLYDKNDKIINNFDLTDYEIKKIIDNDKLIIYEDLS